MKIIIDYFKCHWPKPIFKFFIIFALINLYFDIFHNKVYIAFVQFMTLVIFKDLVTNLVHNDNFVTGLGIAIVGAIASLFKK